MLDRTIAPPAGAIANPDIQQALQVSLSNGIKAYFIRAGDQPVVKLEVIFQCGVWHEQVPGLSWITAKILPEGSRSKSSKQIAELFEYYGSWIEINPGFDSSSIALYAQKKFFRQAAELLAEILFQPLFDEAEIAILKTNKAQQLKVDNEKTHFVASRKIREALFGLEHPYGRSLSAAEVEGLTKENIEAHYNNTFLSAPVFLLSASVDDEELRAVDELFTTQREFHPDSTAEGQHNHHPSSSLYVHRPDSIQSSIRLAYPIPNERHPDHFKLLVLNEVLGGYFGSRLMKNLREDKGYTYGVHSHPIFLRYESFWIISADVIAESTDDAIGEVHKEIDKLKHEPIGQEELQKVKNYMAGSFLASISSPFQLMEKFKDIYSHGWDYSYFDGLFECLKTLSPAELQQTANTYLTADSLHTAIVGKR